MTVTVMARCPECAGTIIAVWRPSIDGGRWTLMCQECEQEV